MAFHDSETVFIPGKFYNITIVTVSGTTDVKRSSNYMKRIRMTPTSKRNTVNDM